MTDYTHVAYVDSNGRIDVYLAGATLKYIGNYDFNHVAYRYVWEPVKTVSGATVYRMKEKAEE